MVTLLILLNLCHFLADYTWLSTPVMLKAKRFGRPYLPIFTHACVHGALMYIVLFCYQIPLLTLFGIVAFQIVSHFVIDVLKGRINHKYEIVQSPAQVVHWVVFGFDQFLHQVVIIIMAYLASN